MYKVILGYQELLRALYMMRLLSQATRGTNTDCDSFETPMPRFSLQSRADVERWVALRELIQHRTMWIDARHSRTWRQIRLWLMLSQAVAALTGGILGMTPCGCLCMSLASRQAHI